MILISHRGNINGSNPKMENKPAYIWEALHLKYQVEIDVWYDNGWWLGHDEPKYKCVRNDLHHCWCHAKNGEALQRLRSSSIYHCFWHEKDTYTLTSSGYIWVHYGRPLLRGSICVMPEKGFDGDLKLCRGICSDFIEQYKKI